MKKILNEIIYGNSSVKSGLFAFAIIALIVFGCTCNDKDGFKFGSKDSNTRDNESDDRNEKKTIEKSDASTGVLPGNDELEEITKTTLLEFNNGLQTENFTDFFNNTSRPFQKSTSPRRLKRQFRKLIDGNADISSIRRMKPSFSPRPGIDNSRRVAVLEIKGEYATRPRASTFELRYVAEGKDWKLINIKIFTNITVRR